jgi:hypothetical protein
MKKQKNTEENTTNFAKEVLERIEKEQVTPKARWQFLVKNYGLWVLWGMSVLVGAGAVAATIFVFANAGWQFYSATHDSLFEFIIDSLPYLWGAVLGVFIFAAYENVRHTKRGYRYPLFAIILFSIIASALGGVVLYAAGFGDVFDEQIGKRIPLHRPIMMQQQKKWVNAERGVLAGEVDDVDANKLMFIIETFDDKEWEVDGSDLNEKDWEALSRFRLVRVIGVPVKEGEEIFHACFVFPWEIFGRRERAAGPNRDQPLTLDRLRGRSPFPPKGILERKSESERSSECGGVRSYETLQALRKEVK